jgi:hypothetical protein
MVFKATFNNISAISWQSVLLVEKLIMKVCIPITYNNNMSIYFDGKNITGINKLFFFQQKVPVKKYLKMVSFEEFIEIIIIVIL